jgi:hypothetical protein
MTSYSYVVRTKSDHSPRRLVDTFLFLPLMTSYCVSITEQTTGKCNLFLRYIYNLISIFWMKIINFFCKFTYILKHWLFCVFIINKYSFALIPMIIYSFLCTYDYLFLYMHQWLFVLHITEVIVNINIICFNCLTWTASLIAVQEKSRRAIACVVAIRVSTSWFVSTLVLNCFAFINI